VFSERPEPPEEHEKIPLAPLWLSGIALQRRYESESIEGRFKFAFKAERRSLVRSTPGAKRLHGHANVLAADQG